MDLLRATDGTYPLTRKSWRGTSLALRSVLLCCMLRATDRNYQLTRKPWRGTSLALRSVLLCGIGNIEKAKSKERPPEAAEF